MVVFTVALTFLPSILSWLILRIINRKGVYRLHVFLEKYITFLLINFIPCVSLIPILLNLLPVPKFFIAVWLFYALFTVALPIVAFGGCMLIELDDHIKEDHGGVDPLLHL
jgi:hypothetical protein